MSCLRFEPRSRSSIRSKWRAGVPLASLVLWGCLWLNLDTGFWNLEQPDTLRKFALAIRAALIFAVLPIALLILVGNHEWLRFPRLSPSRLLIIYGTICAVATIFSPQPWPSFYWAVAFLATLAAACTWICREKSALSSRHMLEVTWAVTLIVAAILAYTVRGAVFGNATYNVRDYLDQASRTSGIARWAAVPGLVCLLKASHARRRLLVALYLTAAALAFFVVYRMQSRGAVFGSVVALAFGLVAATRLRKYLLPLVLLAAALLIVTDPGLTFRDRVYDYLRRGQSEKEFRSLTGRTRVYEQGMGAFQDAPLIGRGHWADRMVIGEHVHNSFLQALLSSGVIGFVPYLGSWVAGWLLFISLLKRKDALPSADRGALVEAGAVMLFFTVRAIPETTTASYAPDLLIMTAVYAYLEQLTIKLGDHRRPGRWRVVRRQPVPRPILAGAPRLN